MKTESLSYESIQDAFRRQPLFEDKTWQISPQPWPLTPDQIRQIESIGQACHEFYRALEMLYLRSAEGKNLLRNKALKAPWVADYLDRGKPRALVEHSRSKRLRGESPRIIRPDLLITENGFAMTEIDSVPGGIGLTAYINRLYGGNSAHLIGGGDLMIHSFYRALASMTPKKSLPLIAILVSDEAHTYRPEMEWLASQLRQMGKRVYCFHPSEIMPLGTTLCASIDGNPEQIDIVYRFWELFDLSNVPIAGYILDAWEDSELVVTPPMRPFQEEKMGLSLFHHHLLEDFWRENLSRNAFKLLRKVIPQSWIVDRVDLPPSAVLDAPKVGGKAIWKWEHLGQASQKERNLILKLSGFHEDAWGARSVLLGSDVPRQEWQRGIGEALQSSPKNLYVLQDYHKPKRLRHPVYNSSGELIEQEGRVRLSPFYFVEEDELRLSGILCTFCPANKKIIHGMRDAAMLPCSVAS